MGKSTPLVNSFLISHIIYFETLFCFSFLHHPQCFVHNFSCLSKQKETLYVRDAKHIRYIINAIQVQRERIELFVAKQAIFITLLSISASDGKLKQSLLQIQTKQQNCETVFVVFFIKFLCIMPKVYMLLLYNHSISSCYQPKHNNNKQKHSNFSEGQ